MLSGRFWEQDFEKQSGDAVVDEWNSEESLDCVVFSQQEEPHPLMS